MDSGPLTEPLPPKGAAASDSPYAVLRHRDFSVYLIARFIAALGQQMLTVAVGWELYERTHQPLALGFVGLSEILPLFMFIIPAGHAADNYDRKWIIVWSQFLAAASAVGLTFISVWQVPVAWTYAC